MIDARLQVALSGGGLDLPSEGRVAVFYPPVSADLSGIDPERCDIIQDFKPSYDAWQGRGYTTTCVAEGPYAAAIVCLPRAKAEARSIIARACEVTTGLVIIDGQKTDGVDSMLKAMKSRVTTHGPISKAHGKLFWIGDSARDFFADWAQGPALTEGGFWTAPGVFSADAVDLASALLVDTLPEDMKGTVVDFGAGWGFLSAHVLTRPGVESVHLVEAGHMALECARRNVTDPRASFHWADATSWIPAERADVVVMNPPFHQARASEPQLGQAFVAAAGRILNARGQLWMVANRHLPYEETLRQTFTEVEEIGGDARFKLFRAARPLARR